MQWDQLPQSRSIEQLYEKSDQPAVVTDDGLGIVWSNERARRLLPFLRATDGILNLLRDEQLAAVAKSLAAGGACMVEVGSPPLSYTKAFFSPVARDRCGYFSLVLFELPSLYNEEKLKEAGDAIASYTVQIRAPLTRIFVSLNLLSTNKVVLSNSTIMDALKNVSQNSYRLLRHCVNMTEYSRFVSGLSVTEPSVVNLSARVAALCKSVRDLMPGTFFDFPPNPEPLYCKCDWRQIEIALLNLFSNACRFLRVDSYIRVEIDKNGPNAVIKICDNGLGIPPELKQAIFRPFFTTDSYVSETPGGGLGLTVARMCIVVNGGTILVDSKLEQGTKMIVSLPLVPPPDSVPILRAPKSQKMTCDRQSNLHVILADVCPTPWP